MANLAQRKSRLQTSCRNLLNPKYNELDYPTAMVIGDYSDHIFCCSREKVESARRASRNIN